MGLNLNQPGFESLHDFIVHELEVMTSDYAQTFFKSDEKDKTGELNSGRYNQLRVRRVTVKTKNETQELLHKNNLHQLQSHLAVSDALPKTNHLLLALSAMIQALSITLRIVTNSENF